eukprot:SAG11_NODE_25043_length_364_cov_1.128302_1_plen_73_part_10
MGKLTGRVRAPGGRTGAPRALVFHIANPSWCLVVSTAYLLGSEARGPLAPSAFSSDRGAKPTARNARVAATTG